MKARLLGKELAKVANSMPRSQFLRISRKVTGDIERPALEMDLSIATPALSSQVPATMRDNEVQEVPDDPCEVAPECRAEGKETGLNLSSDFHDRFKREPFLKGQLCCGRNPCALWECGSDCLGDPVCSAVQVQCVFGE